MYNRQKENMGQHFPPYWKFHNLQVKIFFSLPMFCKNIYNFVKIPIQQPVLSYLFVPITFQKYECLDAIVIQL